MIAKADYCDDIGIQDKKISRCIEYTKQVEELVAKLGDDIL